MSLDNFKYPYGCRSRVQIECKGGRTEQHHKDSCDVNQILKRYQRIHGRDLVKDFRGFVDGEFGDFSDLPTLQEALMQADKAVEAFASLPAQIRKRFGHDPFAVLEFIDDKSNFEEAVALGLLNPLSASKNAAEADVKNNSQNESVAS